MKSEKVMCIVKLLNVLFYVRRKGVEWFWTWVDVGWTRVEECFDETNEQETITRCTEDQMERPCEKRYESVKTWSKNKVSGG